MYYGQNKNTKYESTKFHDRWEKRWEEREKEKEKKKRKNFAGARGAASCQVGLSTSVKGQRAPEEKGPRNNRTGVVRSKTLLSEMEPIV